MGEVSQEKQDSLIMLTKNVITQRVILNVLFHSNERNLDWTKPFAKKILHHLHMKENDRLEGTNLV